MTRIDVMMPVFNGAATIAQAIRSVQADRYGDVGIVVVDDGSSDETGAIVRGLAEADRRIRYIRQENRGIAAARQRALEATESVFVSQLDADDISDPDRLSCLMAHLRDAPGCVAVCGAARHIDADGRPTGHVVRLPAPAQADPHWYPAREPAQLPFALWRRDALMRVGGYRPLVYGEDVDLSWRLAEIGSVDNVAAIVGSYRFHASSTGSSLVGSRILAVDTQRAALSARRRRAGLPDIPFESDLKAAYRGAETLAGMCTLASAHLAADEATALRAASAFKLLGWLQDRRQMPDHTDCTFIRTAYDTASNLSARNRKEIDRSVAVVSARLLEAGEWALAARLTPLRLLPAATARRVMRRY